jgi:RimJ/RimL family protein N-acetyltransferase
MIRFFEERDKEAFMRMARSFYEASPYSHFSLSDKKLLDLFHNACYNKEVFLGLLIVDLDDNPKGMILGSVSTSFFSDDLVGSEIAWWVDEDYRGRESADLVDAFVYWCQYTKKAVACTLALLTETSNPKIEKYYKRLGFRKAEEAYLKEF